jgi:hypothetical protein
VLAQHVETKVFQRLEIILHSFTVGWRVQTIWPVSLIKGAELEYKLAVEKGTLDAVDFSAADSSERGIAVDNIVAEGDTDIVQRRRVWRPQFGAFGFEGESSVGAAAATCELTAICVEDLDLDVRCAVVRGVDSGVYFKRLVGLKT